MSVRWKESFDIAATSMMVISAVLVAAVVLRQHVFTPDPNADKDVSEQWDEIATARNFEGPEDAANVLVQFSDYQCPFCKSFHPVLDSLVRDVPSLRVEHRHLPLVQIHPHAYTAARYSECAADQGRFLEMHRYLFSLQDLAALDPDNAIESVGITDAKRFGDCVSDTDQVAEIEEDVALAERLGLSSTPTVIVNGLQLGRTPTLSRLRELILGDRTTR